ncbi:hypothetical protein HaLaN_15975 [Haematococcus lacustris]|uniref:Uncharacterized protein n=1 Tax=Haematococcus lacustris TaxID=44745 RepID=A0A699ZT06_HAELA|nr:hypothetical protein HaLaN_15975 [Haematococcus lacustris]
MGDASPDNRKMMPGETGREWQEPVVTADSDDDDGPPSSAALVLVAVDR